MKDQPLKILRYNTGTDKKAFVEFKGFFDAVIFNATIVAYSGASVADLVSMHSRKYIIDPQTHIFQQELTAYTVENKKTHLLNIKKSVEKYFSQMPQALTDSIINKHQKPDIALIEKVSDELVECVYKFQTEYVLRFIANKEYDKYLKFAKMGPEPRFVIAPYFMLKANSPSAEIYKILELNQSCLSKTIVLNNSLDCAEIAAQLVLEKDALTPENIESVISTYNISGYEYIFVWVDDFNAFEANPKHSEAFYQLIKRLNSIGKKPIMAYGGYESIVLCNTQSPARLYGVAQSVGYGEYRPITPVGGGLPVNKYYFYPLHYRMRFDDAARILSDCGFVNDQKSYQEHAADYYEFICNCPKCHDIIDNDIRNFSIYNDSIPYVVNTRNGPISKNRPTPDASLIAAIHFLYCKVREWDYVNNNSFLEIIDNLKKCYEQYLPHAQGRIKQWCEIYGK